MSRSRSRYLLGSALTDTASKLTRRVERILNPFTGRAEEVVVTRDSAVVREWLLAAAAEARSGSGGGGDSGGGGHGGERGGESGAARASAATSPPSVARPCSPTAARRVWGVDTEWRAFGGTSPVGTVQIAGEGTVLIVQLAPLRRPRSRARGAARARSAYGLSLIHI